MDSNSLVSNQRSMHFNSSGSGKKLHTQAKIRAHSKRMPMMSNMSDDDDEDEEERDDDEEDEEEPKVEQKFKQKMNFKSDIPRGGVGRKRLLSEDEEDDDGEDDEEDYEDEINENEEVEDEEIVDDGKLSSKDRKFKKIKSVEKSRRKIKMSDFFDEEAGVSSDDEDDEEDDNDEDLIPNDTGKDLEMAKIAAYNRGFDVKRRFNELLSAEDEEAVKRHYEKYTNNEFDDDVQRFGEGERMANDIIQQKLLPGVNHPNLWLVKCRIGEEKQAILQLMRKFIHFQTSANPFCIKSAIAKEGLKGSIYIEAFKQTHVKQAIEGIRSLSMAQYNQPMVPIKEMPDVLRVLKNRIKLSHGQWVRIKKRGIYRDDLAQIDTILDIENSIILKLIPRIDYKRMRGSLRSTNLSNNPDGKEKRFERPPPALFNPDKIHAIGGEWKISTVTHFKEFEGAEYDKEGFGYRKFSFNHVQFDGVVPTLEELERFKESPESLVTNNNFKKSLTQHDTNFIPGDVVQVVKGELNHLQGVVLSVDGNQVTIQPNHSELKDPLFFLASDIKKHFNDGDHVKIISGTHENETGLVIKVTKHEAIVWSDVTHSEIKVAPKLLQLCQERSTGVDSSGHYMIGDLVELAPKHLGVVVRTSKDHLEILACTGRVVTKKQNEVFRKKSNKFARSLDVNGNQLQIKDVVIVNEGPHNSSQGEIKHIFSQWLFCYSRMHLENGGLFVVRSRQVSLRSSISGSTLSNANSQNMAPLSGQLFVPQSPRIGNSMVAVGDVHGGNFSNNFKVPLPRFNNANRSSGGKPEKSLLGKTVRIIKGPMKGKIGIIKSLQDDQCSIELHSEYKTILVKRENVAEIDSQGRIIAPRLGGSSGGNTNDRGITNTPLMAGRTPSTFMFPSSSGSRTPSGLYGAGSMTPVYGGAGSATPYHDGSATPRYGERGGMTPHCEAFDPASATPHSGFGGSSGLVSPASIQDDYSSSRSIFNSNNSQTSYSEDSFMRSPHVSSDYLGLTPLIQSGVRSPMADSTTSSIDDRMSSNQFNSFNQGFPTTSNTDPMPTEYISRKTIVLIPKSISIDESSSGFSSNEPLIRAIALDDLQYGATHIRVKIPENKKVISVMIDNIYKAKPDSGDKVRVLDDETEINLGHCLSVDGEEAVVKAEDVKKDLGLIKLSEMVPYYSDYLSD